MHVIAQFRLPGVLFLLTMSCGWGLGVSDTGHHGSRGLLLIAPFLLFGCATIATLMMRTVASIRGDQDVTAAAESKSAALLSEMIAD